MTGRNRLPTEDRRDHNRGMTTVEASVLVPIIFFLVAGAVLLFLTIGRREQLRGDMCRSLYGLTFSEERDGNMGALLEERVNNASQEAKDAGIEAQQIGDWMFMKAAVPYLKRVKNGVFADMKTDFPVRVGRERDLCGSRLRRWQFYGSLTDNEGD